MRGWLAALVRLPGLRAAPAAAAVRAAVARQLLDTDASVQQAALKCLKVRRLLASAVSMVFVGCMLPGATAAVLLLDMVAGMPYSQGLKAGTLSMFVCASC